MKVHGHILELLAEYRGYPRQVLAAALERVLIGSQSADEALIIAAWLTDPDATIDDCLPLPSEVVARVHQELRARAH